MKIILLAIFVIISHGLHCDTLTIEILLVVPEIWTLLYRAIGSHFLYTEHIQHSTNTGRQGSYVLTGALGHIYTEAFMAKMATFLCGCTFHLHA